MYSQSNNPFKKRMGKFKHSDAPDAKGKFKSLSPSALASWMIKSRKGNLSRIISSLNQQVVFNRGKNPSYARKMKTTMNIVRKRLNKKSPAKSIFGNKNNSILGDNTKSKQEYQSKQKKLDSKNQGIVDNIVSTVVPSSGGEALSYIAGGGIVNRLRKGGSKLYNMAKSFKNVKTVKKDKM